MLVIKAAEVKVSPAKLIRKKVRRRRGGDSEARSWEDAIVVAISGRARVCECVGVCAVIEWARPLNLLDGVVCRPNYKGLERAVR